MISRTALHAALCGAPLLACITLACGPQSGGTATDPALVDLAAFAELRSVGEDLALLHNPKLEALGDLGGPTGSLESIGGTYLIRCSAKLDPATAEAVLAKIEDAVPTDIILDCG